MLAGRRSRTRARRVAAVTIAALLAMCAAMPAATAAPPTNDDITHATVISTVPSRFTVDTREATSDPTDSAGCIGASSVWYRFQPSSDVTARAVTVGSDYDTLLAVFTGVPSQLTQVACNDDRIGLASGEQLHFAASQTYFLAISSFCGEESCVAGGHAVLRLYEPVPFSTRRSTARAVADDVSGEAVLTGEHACSNAGLATFTITIRQRLGSHVARATGTITAWCTARSRPWTLTFDSTTGLAFRPGRARLTVAYHATDGFAAVTHNVTETRRLSPAAGA